jgi:hypothetical protein
MRAHEGLGGTCIIISGDFETAICSHGAFRDILLRFAIYTYLYYTYYRCGVPSLCNR